MRAATALAGLGSAVAALVAARWAFTVVTVTSGSMAPALHAGDRVLVRRCGGGAVRRGDVVLAVLPPAGHPVVLPEPVAVPASGSAPPPPPPVPEPRIEPTDLFVKRVVALPGDVLVREDVLAVLAPGRRPPANLPRGWRIPPNACFFLGDGVESDDSLAWGPVPLRLVVGKVVARAPTADQPRWRRVPASPWAP
jgi:signal peptidase I